MHELVTIGPATVLLRNVEPLPWPLAGLTRLPHEADTAEEAATDATIEVEVREVRDWPLDVADRGDTHFFGRPTYALDVTPEQRHMRLLMTAQPADDDLYWLQRDLFGVLACMSGGLMLHGSAVVTPDGGAWVFCGASGVGKSTVCRLLNVAGFPVINDEVNWLFDEGKSGWHIVNQPFWFAGAQAPSLPVRRFCLLQQAARCALKPPPPRSECFARLLAAHLSIDTRHDFMKARAEALKRFVEAQTIDVLEFNLNTEELLDLLWINATPKHS